MARQEQNLSSYQKSCASQTDLTLFKNCVQKVAEVVAKGELCAQHQFDPNQYRINERSFGELDFYWGIGNLYFLTFRKEYMIDRCRTQMGFWGAILQWDCESEVNHFLESKKL